MVLEICWVFYSLVEPLSSACNSNEVRLVFNTIKTVAWLAIVGVAGLVYWAVYYCTVQTTPTWHKAWV